MAFSFFLHAAKPKQFLTEADDIFCRLGIFNHEHR
jgi:hypothetical protein